MAWLRQLKENRIILFVLTGGSGVLLNLAMTAALTEFYYGREGYFRAYLIGLVVNIIYNFALHSRYTFATKKGHKRRFVVFVLYNFAMTVLQSFAIKGLVHAVGVDYYLPVIAVVIASFSFVTYLIYRFWLFHSPENDQE